MYWNVCNTSRFEETRAVATEVGLCPEKASVEDGPASGGDALTCIRYKDDDGRTPLVHPPPLPQQQCPLLSTQILAPAAPVHPCCLTAPTFPYASTPPPNSFRSSPHRILHPQKFLLCSVPNLVHTKSRGVVPQSTGPPRRRLRRQRVLNRQVSSTSPSISPMAVGRGRMVSHSTTQSNFCP